MMRIRSSGLTDVGLKRPHNEDCFAVLPEHDLYVVADGMGGHAAGEVASQTAVESLSAHVRGHTDGEASPAGVADGLKDAVRAANDAILAAVRERPELYGMGTTVVAARTHETDLIIAHVGDSRAYLMRDDELHLLTSDHSFVNEQMRIGALTPEEARQHRYRNVLTRALGTSDDVEADITSRKLESSDRVLLCSDGLTSMLEDGEIQSLLIQHSDDLTAACQALIEAANSRGGDDNTTLILLQTVADRDE